MDWIILPNPTWFELKLNSIQLFMLLEREEAIPVLWFADSKNQTIDKFIVSVER